MIDRLVCAKGRDRFSEDYSPSQAIRGRQLLNEGADRMAVVFPPWHGGGKLTGALTKRLQRNNWAVLSYDFHDQILEPDIERVPQSFETIQAEVAIELEQIQDTANFRDIHFIGISLGTLAMSLVAEEYPDFSSATFVNPCSELASAMWEGGRTQGIRKGLEERGHKREEVEEAWIGLEPRRYARSFTNKTVQNLISPKDSIILPKYQFEMSEALNDARAHVSNSYSRLGHAASIAMFCYKGGKI